MLFEHVFALHVLRKSGNIHSYSIYSQILLNALWDLVCPVLKFIICNKSRLNSTLLSSIMSCLVTVWWKCEDLGCQNREMSEDTPRPLGPRHSRKSSQWTVYCNITKEFFVTLLDSSLFLSLVAVERFTKHLIDITVYLLVCKHGKFAVILHAKYVDIFFWENISVIYTSTCSSPINWSCSVFSFY